MRIDIVRVYIGETTLSNSERTVVCIKYTKISSKRNVFCVITHVHAIQAVLTMTFAGMHSSVCTKIALYNCGHVKLHVSSDTCDYIHEESTCIGVQV